MKRLYYSYALNHSGVSEQNFLDELKNASGFDFESFFEHYVHGTDPYESIVSDALDFLGLELIHHPVTSYAAGRLGFKYQPGQRGAQVYSIYPGSPANLGGLMLNDEIIAVNGNLCNVDCDNWLNLVDNDIKVLAIARAGKLKEIQLPEVNRFFYAKYSVRKLEQPNTHQKKAFEAWIS